MEYFRADDSYLSHTSVHTAEIHYYLHQSFVAITTTVTIHPVTRH